jgi:hypothetical protein
MDSPSAGIKLPILAEVHQLDPIEQPRYLKLIQEKCGKGRIPISALRQQMKVVRIDGGRGGKGRRSSAQPLRAVNPGGTSWRNDLLLNLNGTVKPVLANAITALRGAPEWSGALAYNEFANCTVLRKPAPWMKPGVDLFEEWTPNHDVLATEWLHHQGIFVSVDVTGQAIEAVARECPSTL